MDGTTVVLGLLAAGGCAAAVWLAIGRARLMAEHARERAGREGAERELATMRAEVERLGEQVAQARETLTKVSVDRAGLDEKLGAEQEAHRTTRQHLQAEHARALSEVEERLNAEIAHAEEIAREQLESVRREKKVIEEQQLEFEKKVREAFGSLAADALAKNREQFLALAEQKFEAKSGKIDELVKPIAETLRKTDAKLAIIEQAGTELRGETSKLVRALREPHVRGRYGEIQLRRVAELAGMSAFCDFTEQEQTRGADGTPLRPDMVVKMPSGRVVVVDAKTNIQGYMDAISAATPELAEICLDRFARHVAEQATALAKKKYWAQYDGSPEFVVMFIPGDQFVDAALTRQPEILENAAQQGVILASPSTLIGLLRAVAVGYKEQQLAHAAEELRELGKELHERVAVAMGHAARLGKNLNQAVDAYNDFVGSYERRLEPVMRKFEEGGVKSAKELPEVGVVAVRAREVEA
jgi:DNA recombination protein RmuC